MREEQDRGPGRGGASPDGAAAVRDGLRDLAELTEVVARELAEPVAAVARLATAALGDGRKLLFCGNGGSAADAQHLAAEYVVRFRRERRALPAVALTTDTSVLTAGANDFGFEEVFARQVRALGRAGDVLFLHSTSGESENLLRAAEAAREGGLVTVGLLARGGGRLRELVDHALVVPTDVTARAQEVHLALGHLICDRVDSAFAGPPGGEGAGTGPVRSTGGREDTKPGGGEGP